MKKIKIMTGWLAAFSFALFVLAMPASAASTKSEAAAPAPLALGSDYAIVDPALLADEPAKIEVLEFFSYACPHCSDLDPLVSQWSAKLPADVAFKRVPVSFNSPFYELMARLYYALDAVGDLPRLHSAVFDAVHHQGVKLIDDKSILEWVTSQGVDAKKFSDAYSSFGVSSKIKRADQLSRLAKIRGVPALVVDGRYLVVGQNIRAHSELLTLTDRVIDKARQERNAKKK